MRDKIFTIAAIIIVIILFFMGQNAIKNGELQTENKTNNVVVDANTTVNQILE